MELRACVFVDGENLRHSLVEALSGVGFRASEYLPPDADWTGLFDWIVSAATNDSHKRLRAYWFVIEHIECYPHGLNKLMQPEHHARLRVILDRDPALRHRSVEFRRAGAISFNLFEERFGQEKCVDIRLACDLLMLRDACHTAIIVSGDQDYVPAAQILKDAGRTVVNVVFEKRRGMQLPEERAV